MADVIVESKTNNSTRFIKSMHVAIVGTKKYSKYY